MVELFADIVRDVFDDLGVAVDVVEIILEESLVEGEDAFEFDAEGDLEGRVDHVDGVLLMKRACCRGASTGQSFPRQVCVQARHADQLFI